MRDEFLHRKEQILSKLDKSFKQSIDEKIQLLCNTLNSSENYYTTSSCAGRILIKELNISKQQNIFLFVSHNLINIEEINNSIREIKEEQFPIEIKQESAIIHVVSRDQKYALELMQIAKQAGFNQSGIISIKEWGVVVECICDISLQLPMYNKQFIQNNQEYLKQTLDSMNQNLESTWKSIDELEKLFIS